MDFPQTNKVHQNTGLNEEFGNNAKILEESLKKIDWRFFVKFYFGVLGLLLVTVFGLVLVVKLATALGNLFV